uniref:N-acetylated-alpha-linked acidic dipeptidase 2 n=1 Tax=Globodera pallida TaxID=36090 RepID=A0A183BS25_GLOPA
MKQSVTTKKHQFDVNEIRASIFASIDPKRITESLEKITARPHQAGTEANRDVAKMIAGIWKEKGLEDVHFIPYKVLLSYPNFQSPNHVSVLDEDGKTLFQTSGVSADLVGDDSSVPTGIQWLAYSANGTVDGKLVNCHYGSVADFVRLEKEFGKIAIMRYGRVYRGDMVRRAAERGAIGAIIYSDPAEVAKDGTEPSNVFPATDWLPPSGVQRGSLLEANGDPLSPLLPARKDFHKEKTIAQAQNERLVPSIPAVPIGYGDAVHLLSRLGGVPVPEEWLGALNISYRIGPEFRKGKGQMVKLEVKSTLEIRTIQNVIGYIWGSEYPDEWVMLGNHFDAWVFGAVDPNSGTSILAEVARAFVTTIRATGWRPKRTLVFCAWDAEEYGLTGSVEFTEEFANVLSERAVVYLNLDLISSNQTLDVHAVPTLHKAVVDSAKLVPDPIDAKRTMFDTWKAHFPPKEGQDMPQMGVPGSESDHWNFMNFLGIPVADFTYRSVDRVGYPLYHSRYELPLVNEHLFDPNHFAVHKAMGQFWAELARSFADSELLPFSPGIFAHKLMYEYLDDLQQSIFNLYNEFPTETEPAKRQLNSLVASVLEFIEQADKAKAVPDDGAKTAEWLNGRLRKLDRCFVNAAMGMAREHPGSQHVLYSLTMEDMYPATVMGAVKKRRLNWRLCSNPFGVQ